MDIIDGYNVLFQELGHQNPDMTSEQLRKERKRFVKTLKQFSEDRKRLTYVVFDGDQSSDFLFWKRKKSELLTVMFGNENEEADDIIVDLVEGQRHANQVLVVTEDREIKQKVREVGAKIESSSKYLARVKSFRQEEREQDHSKEPAEKHGDQPVNNVEEWLEYFGIDQERDRDTSK